MSFFSPGCWAKTNAGSDSLENTRCSELKFRESTKFYSDHEYAEELHHSLWQAVRRQLVRDTEVGSFLSEELDS